MKSRLILLLLLVAGGWGAWLRNSGVDASRQVGIASTTTQDNFRESRAAVTRSPEEDFTFFLSQLDQAVRGGQEDEIRAALERLSRHLSEHPEEFADTLERIKSEGTFNHQIHLLAEWSVRFGLEGTNKLFSEAALALAQESEEPEVRQLALAALGTSSTNNAQAIELVQRLSREDGDMAVRHSAIGAMAAWMANQPDLHSSLTKALMETVRTATAKEIRWDALQILIAHNGSLPGEVRETINAFLENKPSVEDRLMVALAVGTSTPETRDFALTQLGEAYRQDENISQRRHILAQIARFGGEYATEFINELPVENQLLAQDASDYREIFAGGVTDPAGIEQEKNQRDQQRGTPLHESSDAH